METKILKIYGLMQDIPAFWKTTLGFFIGVLTGLNSYNFPAGELFLCLIIFSLVSLKRQFYFVSAVILGFIFSLIYIAVLIDKAPAKILLEQHLVVYGKIVKVNSYENRSYDFVINKSYFIDKTPTHFSGKIRLNWYKKDVYPNLNETWQLEVKIKQLHSILNTKVKDFTASKIADGILASGYVGNKFLANKLSASPEFTQRKNLFIQKLKSSNIAGIKFIMALVLGDTSLFKSSDWNIFKKTGTLHLWIISGLHLGMLSSVLLLIFKLFTHKKSNIFVLISVIVPIYYAVLTGWGIAAQRASFMLIASSLLMLGIRNLNLWSIYSIALIAVLIYNPLVILTAGFWLSFSAVASLIFGLKARKINKIHALLLSQILIYLILAPILNYFSELPNIVTPLINLLLIPLITILLPLAMLAVLLYASLDIGFLLNLIGGCFDYIFIILQYASKLNYELPVYSPRLLVFGWFILLPLGFYTRFVGILAFCMAFFPITDKKTNTWSARFIDVGQGLAILIEKNHKFLLYDTGLNYSKTYAPIILPLKKLVKTKQLDYLIISHADKDHSGALPLIQQNFIIKRHIGYKGEPCLGAKTQIWQGLELNFLGPNYYKEKPKNSESCTLLIKDKYNNSFLITGDILGKQEITYLPHWQKILKNNNLTLLSVAHHGSNSSSYATTIAGLKPKYAVYSAGFRNYFHHPDTRVIKRFYKYDTWQLNTGTMGSIKFDFSATAPTIISERAKRQYLWNYLYYK